jgi:hypothetical protein
MLVTTVIVVELELVSFVVTLLANKLLISEVDVVGEDSPLALVVIAADCVDGTD